MRVSPYTILFSSSFRLTSLLDPNQANSAPIRPPSNASTPSQPSNPSSDHHGAPARLVERDAKKLNPTQRQTRCRGRLLRHLAMFIHRIHHLLFLASLRPPIYVASTSDSPSPTRSTWDSLPSSSMPQGMQTCAERCLKVAHHHSPKTSSNKAGGGGGVAGLTMNSAEQ